MTTIKGIYENGEIKLLEEAPSNHNQKVLITFIDDEVESDLRNISLNNSSSWFKNYLEDSGEDLYNEYLKK
jgi:hypothetical protein